MNLIMREKHLSTILAIEAALCVLFSILQHSTYGLFSTMIAFPFEQLGIMLRGLSLSGTVGNVVAVILYVLISLIPVGILLFLKKKQKSEKIDNILFLLSASLFLVLFYMINPGLLEAGIPETGRWALGSTFYSLLLGYLLIRSLLHYKNAGIKQLQKGIYLLLGVLNVVFVYAIFGQELGQWLQNIETVQNGNSGVTINDGFITSSTLTVTYIFLFLHFLMGILPYILNIVIIFLSRQLLVGLKENPYQEETIRQTKKLAEVCMGSVMATIVADILFNLLQLFFQKQLYQINYVVQFPVFSIVFVLAVLLFARYIKEMQELKEENDLFI